MELLEGRMQMLMADMGVPVGGGDISMAEQLLDDPQIGPVLQ